MLNLEVKLISIKAGCGKNEYLEHSHPGFWSVEKLHSKAPGGAGAKVEERRVYQAHPAPGHDSSRPSCYSRQARIPREA